MSSSTDFFDAEIDRSGTNAVKWDYRPTNTAGKPLLPMWVADMDFPAPPAVVEAIARRTAHPVYGYTFASDGYWEAFVDWQQTRNDWKIDRSSLVFAPAVMPAVRAAVLAFTEPGDGVVIQPPVYFPFYDAIRDNSRTVVENPLREADGYRMDLDRLEAAIGPKTRMLLLCSPHNPVGRVWSADELRALGEICIRHDLVVVSDEIHSDIRRAGTDFVPFASLGPEYAARTVACHAPSKTFNIAGLASSTIVIPDEGLRARFTATLGRLGMTLPNIASLEAAQAAYTHGHEWTDALLRYLDDQIEWFAAQIVARFGAGIVASPVEGTYLAWLDVRPLVRRLGCSQADVQHALLEEAALWLSEGTQFGAGGEGFFRMNLATRRALVEDGLGRLEHAVRFLEATA